MLELFNNYTFIIVLSGTALLGLCSAIVGSITVLKSQSLIGDCIGHSSFLGIMVFFMLFMSRHPFILMLGAIISGLIAFYLIRIIDKHSKLASDSILAIVLSSFFGMGMVLKSYVSGNDKYVNSSQSGLQTYIFGQAAYMNKADRVLIIVAASLILLVFFIFYKEIKLFIFDESYSNTIGLSSKVINFIVMLMTISIISIGLKIVGAILISAMLITPSVAALQLSNRYSVVLFLSGIFGCISAIIGTYLSSVYKGMSTGPSIVLVMSCIAVLSLIIANIKRIILRRRTNA